MASDDKNAEWFESYLHNLLGEIVPTEIQEITEMESPSSVITFDDAGLLTRNRGVIVRFKGGSEFQLTIVQVN